MALSLIWRHGWITYTSQIFHGKELIIPQEVLKVGDEIEVSVLKYDEEKNRVSLGMKQLTEDPWEKVDGNIELNEVYESTVVNIADYGVFVDLGTI